jgi:hypothetical protein
MTRSLASYPSIGLRLSATTTVPEQVEQHSTSERDHEMVADPLAVLRVPPCR